MMSSPTISRPSTAYVGTSVLHAAYSSLGSPKLDSSFILPHDPLTSISCIFSTSTLTVAASIPSTNSTTTIVPPVVRLQLSVCGSHRLHGSLFSVPALVQTTLCFSIRPRLACHVAQAASHQTALPTAKTSTPLHQLFDLPATRRPTAQNSLAITHYRHLSICTSRLTHMHGEQLDHCG